MSDPALAAMAPTVETQIQQGSESKPAGEVVNTGNVDAVGKWVEQVSPEHRNYEFLKGKSKIDDLIIYAKSRDEELAKLGEEVKSIPPKKPGPDAKSEDIQAWREAVGLPKAKTEFVFKKDGDLSGFPENKELEDFYADMFYELELPKDKSEAIWNKISLKGKAIVEQQIAKAKADREAADSALRKTFGQEYDAKMKIVTDFAKANFGEESWKIIETSGLGNRMDFIAPLLEIGSEFGTGRFVKGSSSGQTKDLNAGDVLFPSLKKK